MDRLGVLARRVRWLDRYRRAISAPVGIAVGALLFVDLRDVDWPTAHLWMLAPVATATTWLVTEVALAAVAAVWDTQHSELLRERGLPEARLLRKRRRADR
jgi:hypothetical protein